MFRRMPFVASFTVMLAACGGGGGSTDQPPVNSAPMAAADFARMRPGVHADLDVLANDRDGDGDALTIEAPAAHASAAFAVIAGNRLRVTPAAGFSGTLSFSYRARDSRGAFSAPANVTVEVGPLGRAMLVVAPTAAGSARIVIAGVPSGERRELLTLGTCNQGGWAAISGDGRRILGRSCLSASRADIILSQPRAATLAAPAVIYGNAPLAPGLVIIGNLAEFLVAERVSNPDDLSLGSTYDLVRVDVAQRAAVQRMPLTGIDQVSLVRYGGARRALLMARETNGDSGLFIADLDAGTVRRVTAPDDIDIEYSTLSPDGRFLVSNWPIPGSVRGYDTQGATQPQTLWTVPGAGPVSYVTSMQFLPEGGATLLVEVMDLFTRDTAVWIVPLATPANARELVRFTASGVHLRMQVRNDVGVFAADAGSGRSHVNRVRISTGELLGALTPAGGVALESVDMFTGTSLLFTMLDDGQRRRGARVHVDAPGVVQVIAPALEAELFSMTIDQDETTIALRASNGAGELSAWLVDVNLPATAVPVAGELQPAENAHLAQSLGAPDP